MSARFSEYSSTAVDGIFSAFFGGVAITLLLFVIEVLKQKKHPFDRPPKSLTPLIISYPYHHRRGFRVPTTENIGDAKKLRQEEFHRFSSAVQPPALAWSHMKPCINDFSLYTPPLRCTLDRNITIYAHAREENGYLHDDARKGILENLN